MKLLLLLTTFFVGQLYASKAFILTIYEGKTELIKQNTNRDILTLIVDNKTKTPRIFKYKTSSDKTGVFTSPGLSKDSKTFKQQRSVVLIPLSPPGKEIRLDFQ